MKKKRVLIIDQNNAFIRAYIVNPSISQNGNPIGGLQGSLKILQKLCRETKPDKVVICWDGPGGSKKRKQLNKGYKAGRSPIRLNWNPNMMTNEEQHENKVWQMQRLSEYYDEMPVHQFLQDNVEADDLISAVCGLESLKDWEKVIVSSDKDFIQLCNQNTVLYRPIQKEVLNSKKVVDKYGIHPSNFALARAIVGDKSDNIDGVRGIGMKTVAKRLSFLGDLTEFGVSELFDRIHENLEDPELNELTKPDIKVFEMIQENRSLIEDNYNIMQLYVPSIGVRAKNNLKKSIEKEDLSWHKTKFRTMMIKDGFGVWDWETLIQTFNRIVLNK